MPGKRNRDNQECILYHPCTTTKTTIFVHDTHFKRTDDLPWPSHTYLIYVAGHDAIFGAARSLSEETTIENCKWKIVFSKCTAFFCLFNEKTGYYIRLLEGSAYAPSYARMSSAFLPLRHPSGGYLPIWFQDVFMLDHVAAHAEVQPVQGYRWEFIRV